MEPALGGALRHQLPRIATRAGGSVMESTKFAVSRNFSIGGAVGALVLILAASSAAGDRIVAVGDVHGAYPQFVRILQRTGLLDAEGWRWIGGAAVLVQTGDVTSRGTRTRECLELLMELERQAPRQNGRVLALLGNHEVMVIMGDLRYVTPADYRSHATEQSEAVRQKSYEDYLRYQAERRLRLGPAARGEPGVDREKWVSDHPPGFFELRDAYGPEGLYGHWLRERDVIAQVGDVLFLHGGLSPGLRFRNIADLNQQIRAELVRFDRLWRALVERRIVWPYMRFEEAIREAQMELVRLEGLGEEADGVLQGQLREFLNLPTWLSVSPKGPLWYRGYALEPEEKLAKGLEKVLSRLKVHHFVVAHTITDSRRIVARFDGRVFLIDTAMMLEDEGQGRASALEINSGTFVARYLGGEPHVLLRAPGRAEPTAAEGNDSRKP